MSSQASQTRKMDWGAYRIYLIFTAIVLIGAFSHDLFMSEMNLKTILDDVAFMSIVAIGFTITLLAGQLDLSIGSAMTIGMVLVMKFSAIMPLPAALLLTVAAGSLIGLFNGWVTSKIKIDPFVVTLATLIMIENLSKIIAQNDTLLLADQHQAFSEWLNTSFLGPVSHLMLIALILVIAFNLFLLKTPMGRNFYLLGANAKTAWYSGINTDKYIMAAFIISGCTATLGGAMLGIAQGASSFTIGPAKLMIIIAAVIVGGTSMQGGRGSVFQSLIALIALGSLVKLFNLFGAGQAIIEITNGLVLALVILYDAYNAYLARRVKGQRHELLEEFDENGFLTHQLNDSENETMQKQNHALPIVCVTAIACTAMVAIMSMHNKSQPVYIQGGAQSTSTDIAQRPPIESLKATDGQNLLPTELVEKDVPAPAKNYQNLPQEDPRHWFEKEYGMHLVERSSDYLKSPQTDPAGKKVFLLQPGIHAYHTAFAKGAQTATDHYGMTLKVLNAKSDARVQQQQVEQAILEKADLVVLIPLEEKTSERLLKKLFDAGVPTIVSNARTTNKGLTQTVAWSGPDDWGNMRSLSRILAKELKGQGQYGIIRHIEGNPCAYSRTFGFISELAQVAPEMECVAKEFTKLDKETTARVVAGWLKTYPDLKAICLSDDSGAFLGVYEALEAAGRTDIVCVSAGNSKVGMDSIKEGKLLAVNYQSSETDGALPVHLGAQWISGEEIPLVNYLPKVIIDQSNVDDFYPAQW